MKRNILLMLFIGLLTINNIFAQKKVSHDSFIESKRKQAKDLLKDYFLFHCINYGLLNNGDSTLLKDRSKLFYEAWLSYIPNDELLPMLNYAKRIGGAVLFNSEAEKQSLIGGCMNGYRAIELEKIIDTIVKKSVIREKKND